MPSWFQGKKDFWIAGNEERAIGGLTLELSNLNGHRDSAEILFYKY